MLTLREKHEYEQEIASLKESLRVMSLNHSDIKYKYGNLKVKYNKLITTRTDIARGLLVTGCDGVKMRLQDVATECGLSYHTVGKLSSELKRVNDA